VKLASPTQAAVAQPSHRAWWIPARSRALRLVVALAFLAGLGAALTLLRPPPASPRVRITLPPPLPDPTALLPYRPETAREANAAMPITPPSVAAPAFRIGPGGTAVTDPAAQNRALDCLAAAAWYEAGDDPSGERSVVQVVLNRARHPAFPSSVCGVVFQGSERATGCQFSFTCDGSMQSRHPGPAAWARARAVATAALTGGVDSRVGLATHYHADYVVPVWRGGLVKLAQVGLHLFYRWPGTWGAPSVLRKAASGDEPRVAALATLSHAHLGPGGETAEPTEPEGRAARLPYLPLEDADGPIKSVGSGMVIPPAGNTNPITIMFDPAVFPGTYAMRALAVCAEKERCAVFGQLVGAAPGQGPGFIYVRDRRTGAEGAWWDCKALPRANPTRCLPKGPALAKLIEDWG
jgi:hypothetical protein